MFIRVVYICFFILSFSLCSCSKEKPKLGAVNVLHSYLSDNYKTYRFPDDEETQLLQNDLQNAKNCLDLTYPFNECIAINGIYPPDERWSFFKYSCRKKIYGIFYGSKYKIIVDMVMKNYVWEVADLYALRYIPRGTHGLSQKHEPLSHTNKKEVHVTYKN